METLYILSYKELIIKDHFYQDLLLIQKKNQLINLLKKITLNLLTISLEINL
jgi:hypothetical protein